MGFRISVQKCFSVLLVLGLSVGVSGCLKSKIESDPASSGRSAAVGEDSGTPAVEGGGSEA